MPARAKPVTPPAPPKKRSIAPPLVAGIAALIVVVATGVWYFVGTGGLPLVGVFAQRGKDRPNRVGVTICRLLSVEDLSLEVLGLDAIDGTPVLDIKPCMRQFAARGEVRQPKWVDDLMSGYWENSYFG